MEEKMLIMFKKENGDINPIDHNGNYDYRYIEFLYDKIEELDNSFCGALRIIDNLGRL